LFPAGDGKFTTKRTTGLTEAVSRLKSELNPTNLSPGAIDRLQQDASELRQGVLFVDNDPLTQR
jgi:hypothetical protein